MKLQISKDFYLPIDTATQTLSILARKRVGKTYTASVIAEEFVKANIPFVVLDPTGAWWGLGSGKNGEAENGLPVYIIGGAHGIPLEPTAGKVIAEQVAIYPSFYVIDVSQFESNAAQDRFATDFAERLYRIKEKHKEPLHLFIDEADAFVPQRPMPGQQRMLGAFEAIVRRGGIRGIGITLISQRAAIVNKNVLTQTECLIVLQTTSPQDQNAIEDWIKRNGTDEERKTLMSSLASLQKSEAWIYSPGWLEILKKINIRERNTFNSSATPKVGDKQIINAKLKPVNLEKLSEQIKSTIEKVKENDPALLKKRIRELESKGNNPTEKQLNDIWIKAKGEVAKEYQISLQNLEGRIELLNKELNVYKATIEKISHFIEVIPKKEYFGKTTQENIITKKINPVIGSEQTKSLKFIHTTRQQLKKEYPPLSFEGEMIKLRAGAKRLLAALVQWSPQGMTEGQMRSHAGLKNSGTYSAYKTDLRTSGFIEERGGLLYATENGIEYLGHEIPSPSTTDEVLAVWLPKLRLGARRMIQVLVENKGEPITDLELQEATNLSNSGTYSAYKTELKTAQLVITENGTIRANKETLFL